MQKIKIHFPRLFNDVTSRCLMGETFSHTIFYNVQTGHWNCRTYATQPLTNQSITTKQVHRAIEKLESLKWMTNHRVMAVLGMVVDDTAYTGWAQITPNASYTQNGHTFIGNILIQDTRNNVITMGPPICVHKYSSSQMAVMRGMGDFLYYLTENSAFRRSLQSSQMSMR